jgi:outer membrane cobalamin receptor
MELKSVSMAACVCVAGSVWAQQAEIKQLEAVTVSAGPIIESNNVGSFSTLTTRVGEAQIEDMGALDLAAGLRMTPGVQICRRRPKTDPLEANVLM